MGRNRKGRQCGGYGSKKERFVLLRRWQQEVAKVTRKNAQSRQALADQHRRAETNDAVRRRVRVDVLTAWTNARLKDDHIERIKREGALSIASELQKTSVVGEFSSLQERWAAICYWKMTVTTAGLVATAADGAPDHRLRAGRKILGPAVRRGGGGSPHGVAIRARSGDGARGRVVGRPGRRRRRHRADASGGAAAVTESRVVPGPVQPLPHAIDDNTPAPRAPQDRRLLRRRGGRAGRVRCCSSSPSLDRSRRCTSHGAAG
ncbi:hypothetical protein ON010_g10116 [Phytophthora cinnamomi]|nr:hypothetical protein ON010_g10116 [Phytophthora cinnamomi]